MHSLGATHEQNREDRDMYVRIVDAEISVDSKKNFEKKGSLFSSYGTPYDFDSVMHYDDTAFSTSRAKTIIPLEDNITLTPVSHKLGLSPIDAMELARVYDILTLEDCFKRHNILDYLNIVEDKLEKEINKKKFEIPKVTA